MKVRPGLLLLRTTLAGLAAVLIAGCSKPQEAPRTLPPGTIGTEMDDSILSTRVKSALLADPDVKRFDFRVETRKGEVQVSGFVDSQAQIDRAIAVTRGVVGVKSVENKVSLIPAKAG